MLKDFLELLKGVSLSPVQLSLELAAVTTLVLLLIGLPLSWWLAHTIGEFGVVLMIGGNIPGKTQVVSTEIYTHVEAMEYAQAHVLAGGMLIFSFIVLMSLNLLNKRRGGE